MSGLQRVHVCVMFVLTSLTMASSVTLDIGLATRGIARAWRRYKAMIRTRIAVEAAMAVAISSCVSGWQRSSSIQAH